MQKKYFNSKDARFLLEYGFSIFPVHGINEDGNCTCGNAACTNKGKHPACANGRTSASNDIDKVLSLWQARKCLNVGVATGEPSNCFVLDIDGEVGETDLAALETTHGKLPDTLQQTTGRGRHIFFKYPDVKVPNRSKVIGDKIDVRGEGGYVVSYKSNHANGGVYEFMNQLEDIEPAPQWLLDIITRKDMNKSEQKLNICSQTLNLNNDGWSQSDIQNMLDKLHPDSDGYDAWKDIGMALKDYNMPFTMFDAWSARGSKHQGRAVLQRKWDGFTGTGVSIGTLYHYAKQAGFNPSDYKEATPVPQVSVTAATGEIINNDTGEVVENKFHFIDGDNVGFTTDTNDFVQGLLTKGGMSVIYGESNCGKTFFMTDLAFHIVNGKMWNGKRVEQGKVVYVALEGLHGLKGRIEAYKRHTCESLKNLQVMPCAIDFLNPDEDIKHFLALLAQHDDIKLIVIDTLARAIGGGDENSGQDMGLLVKHADLIRNETDAHISFVHHSGKDRAKGARGHSSLRAAVDTEIEVSRETDADYSNVKTVKQRDMEFSDDIQFKLKQIKLGVNKYDEDVSSCVVEPYNLNNDIDRVRFIKPNLRIAHEAFLECISEKGRHMSHKNVPHCKVIYNDEFKDYIEKRGLLSEKESSARVQYSNYRKELIEQKLVVYRDGFLWSYD